MAGEDFTLDDFLSQMQALRKMGSLGKLLGMLPGMGEIRDQIDNLDEKEIDRVQAIIQSMTPPSARTSSCSTARAGHASPAARACRSARSTDWSSASARRRR